MEQKTMVGGSSQRNTVGGEKDERGEQKVQGNDRSGRGGGK